MKPKGLDEMQKINRDRIGNQTFMLAFYLLLIDMGLYGMGVRWLPYPTNVIVILITCMFIYLMRLILSSAYIGPARTGKASAAKIIGVVVVAVVFAAAAELLLKNRLAPQPTDDGGRGAIVLFVSSTVFLIIAGVTALIRGGQNRKDE